MPIRNQDPFLDITADIDPAKNPYVQKVIENAKAESLPLSFGPMNQTFVGRWRECFKRPDLLSAPLVLEIGCHLGHTLIDMAQALPNVGFIGMDITFKRVFQTAEKVNKLGLSNVFIVMANAHQLNRLFGRAELSGVVTFFPDPWKKRQHAHYRLYQDRFFQHADYALADDGFIWLKTDHEQYFDDSLRLATSNGFLTMDQTPVFGSMDFSSTFQRRFELHNLPMYSVKWKPSFPRVLPAKFPLNESCYN
jgi:tRNA (guanine-N7-)-methyltransferase